MRAKQTPGPLISRYTAQNGLDTGARHRAWGTLDPERGGRPPHVFQVETICDRTVEAHRARLFKKLGASNVADAVLLAIRVGLVTP